MIRKPVLILPFALLALLGCGSTAKNSMVNPSPTPAPAAASDTYIATMFQLTSAGAMPVGQITVDTFANTGVGKVQINGAGLTSAQTLQFCPFAGMFLNCVTVPVTAGTGGSNFQMPLKGAFAGNFRVFENGLEVLRGGFGGVSSVNFRSTLLRAATITGGIGAIPGSLPTTAGPASLTSGSAVVTGSALHIMLNGTTPGDSFSVSFCDAFGASSCTIIGHVASDAGGNLVGDVPLGTFLSGAGFFFELSDSAGVEFISAFRVT